MSANLVKTHMDDRKKELLQQIIRSFIKTAEPVGSKFLQSKGGLGVSSATIRNEMAELEKEGYISQPHTSAGRVPTEKGYQYFLANYLSEGRLSDKHLQALREVISLNKKEPVENLVKHLSRKIAEISNNAVFAAFSETNLYYTGISNLFAQPEFRNSDLIYHISSLIDHLDQVVEDIYPEIDEIKTFLGSDNPFGQSCSAMITRWQFEKQEGILGILAPIRTDYEKNMGILKFISNPSI